MRRILIIFIIILIGLLTAGGAFWLLRGDSKPQNAEEDKPIKEETVKELPIEERPFVSLTPRADGHEFHLSVSGIPNSADSLEYELVYKVASGVTQGVPGTVKLSGKTSIERDLLLGTCSSGKCRYDEGVEKGMFTVRLRDDDGKLISKLETEFHLQQDGKSLTSSDGKFSISSASFGKSTFYLTMNTFGLPDEAPGKVTSGPYGTLTKGVTKVSGTVTLDGSGTLYGWNGSKWVMLDDGKTSFLGTFIRVASE